MRKAFTIAGSDSGGGAGIQADLKTFMAFGVYGMSALTAVTAQNSIGVQGVSVLEPVFVMEQIKSIMTDIGTDAAKTGMLANESIVRTVAQAIERFCIPNVVVDPVMISKSRAALLSEDARATLKERLIPLASVITPNLYEAEVLLGCEIVSLEDMKSAAVALKKLGCRWVVVKGGHRQEPTEAVDVAYDGKEFHFLKFSRYDTKNTHGTGCTFSAAIAAGLAKGYEPLRAIQKAKEYISLAIQNGLPIGKGYGPTNHMVGVETRW